MTLASIICISFSFTDAFLSLFNYGMLEHFPVGTMPTFVLAIKFVYPLNMILQCIKNDREMCLQQLESNDAYSIRLI